MTFDYFCNILICELMVIYAKNLCLRGDLSDLFLNWEFDVNYGD